MKKQKEFNLTDDKFNEENNTLSYNQLMEWDKDHRFCETFN